VATDTDKLQGVITRLTPLSAVVSGDLIRAQDWNALVAALVDVARAVLAEVPTSVPAHDHLGQVKNTWLDPALSTVIQRGPLAEPDTVARLGAAERAVASVDVRVKSVGDELGQLRLRLNEVSARDLDRASQVSSLGLRLSGVQDAHADIDNLRTTLASVQDAVGRALAVAQQLTVNGQPIDLGAFNQRLGDLEHFREGLREADGNLLDSARLHQDLQQATASFATADQVAAAVAAHTATVAPADIQKISDGIRAQVRADVDQRVTQLGDAIRADTTTQLAGIDASVARAISDALPSFTDAALAKVRPELSSAIAAANSDLQQLIERRVNETSAALSATFDGRLGDLQRSLPGAVTTEINKQLVAALDPLQKSLTDLTAKATQLRSDLTAQSTTVATLGQRVETVANADTTARAALETSLRSLIAERITTVTTQIDTRVTALDTTVNQRIAQSASALRAELGPRRGPLIPQ
jgi:hypothetical protein